MDFVGTGERMTPGDIRAAAQMLKCDEAAIRAVVEVEAASFGFDDKNRPRILFEPHIFWRELGAGTARDEAARHGLAYRRWGERAYPRTMDARFEQLRRAMRIDRDAALKSASWGLGQIMGFNYSLAGYASPSQMVQSMKLSEGEQLMAMCRFIQGRGLDRALREHDWTTFARGYNGPGFAKHGYHTRLANAHKRHQGSEPDGMPVLRIGARNAAVRRLQEHLNAFGFGLAVDGVFGKQTLKAVHALQERYGLLVDGVVGKATWNVLYTGPDGKPEKLIPDPPDVEHVREKKSPVKEAAKSPEGKAGIVAAVGTAGAAASGAAEQIAPFAVVDAVRWVFVGLVVIGVAFTIYATIRRAERENPDD